MPRILQDLVAPVGLRLTLLALIASAFKHLVIAYFGPRRAIRSCGASKCVTDWSDRASNLLCAGLALSIIGTIAMLLFVNLLTICGNSDAFGTFFRGSFIIVGWLFDVSWNRDLIPSGSESDTGVACQAPPAPSPSPSPLPLPSPTPLPVPSPSPPRRDQPGSRPSSDVAFCGYCYHRHISNYEALFYGLTVVNCPRFDDLKAEQAERAKHTATAKDEAERAKSRTEDAERRAETKRQVASEMTKADQYSREKRGDADRYSRDVRKDAIGYSRDTRTGADDYSRDTRKRADDYAAGSRKDANKFCYSLKVKAVKALQDAEDIKAAALNYSNSQHSSNVTLPALPDSQPGSPYGTSEDGHDIRRRAPFQPHVEDAPEDEADRQDDQQPHHDDPQNDKPERQDQPQPHQDDDHHDDSSDDDEDNNDRPDARIAVGVSANPQVQAENSIATLRPTMTYTPPPINQTGTSLPPQAVADDEATGETAPCLAVGQSDEATGESTPSLPLGQSDEATGETAPSLPLGESDEAACESVPSLPLGQSDEATSVLLPATNVTAAEAVPDTDETATSTLAPPVIQPSITLSPTGGVVGGSVPESTDTAVAQAPVSDPTTAMVRPDNAPATNGTVAEEAVAASNPGAEPFAVNVGMAAGNHSDGGDIMDITVTAGTAQEVGGAGEEVDSAMSDVAPVAPESNGADLENAEMRDDLASDEDLEWENVMPEATGPAFPPVPGTDTDTVMDEQPQQYDDVNVVVQGPASTPAMDGQAQDRDVDMSEGPVTAPTPTPAPAAGVPGNSETMFAIRNVEPAQAHRRTQNQGAYRERQRLHALLEAQELITYHSDAQFARIPQEIAAAASGEAAPYNNPFGFPNAPPPPSSQVPSSAFNFGTNPQTAASTPNPFAALGNQLPGLSNSLITNAQNNPPTSAIAPDDLMVTQTEERPRTISLSHINNIRSGFLAGSAAANAPTGPLHFRQQLLERSQQEQVLQQTVQTPEVTTRHESTGGEYRIELEDSEESEEEDYEPEPTRAIFLDKNGNVLKPADRPKLPHRGARGQPARENPPQESTTQMPQGLGGLFSQTFRALQPQGLRQTRGNREPQTSDPPHFPTPEEFASNARPTAPNPNRQEVYRPYHPAIEGVDPDASLDDEELAALGTLANQPPPQRRAPPAPEGSMPRARGKHRTDDMAAEGNMQNDQEMGDGRGGRTYAAPVGALRGLHKSQARSIAPLSKNMVELKRKIEENMNNFAGLPETEDERLDREVVELAEEIQNVLDKEDADAAIDDGYATLSQPLPQFPPAQMQGPAPNQGLDNQQPLPQFLPEQMQLPGLNQGPGNQQPLQPQPPPPNQQDEESEQPATEDEQTQIRSQVPQEPAPPLKVESKKRRNDEDQPQDEDGDEEMESDPTEPQQLVPNLFKRHQQEQDSPVATSAAEANTLSQEPYPPNTDPNVLLAMSRDNARDMIASWIHEIQSRRPRFSLNDGLVNHASDPARWDRIVQAATPVFRTQRQYALNVRDRLSWIADWMESDPSRRRAVTGMVNGGSFATLRRLFEQGARASGAGSLPAQAYEAIMRLADLFPFVPDRTPKGPRKDDT